MTMDAMPLMHTHCKRTVSLGRQRSRPRVVSLVAQRSGDTGTPDLESRLMIDRTSGRWRHLVVLRRAAPCGSTRSAPAHRIRARKNPRSHRREGRGFSCFRPSSSGGGAAPFMCPWTDADCLPQARALENPRCRGLAWGCWGAGSPQLGPDPRITWGSLPGLFAGALPPHPRLCGRVSHCGFNPVSPRRSASWSQLDNALDGDDLGGWLFRSRYGDIDTDGL